MGEGEQRTGIEDGKAIFLSFSLLFSRLLSVLFCLVLLCDDCRCCCSILVVFFIAIVTFSSISCYCFGTFAITFVVGGCAGVGCAPPDNNTKIKQT